MWQVQALLMTNIFVTRFAEISDKHFVEKGCLNLNLLCKRPGFCHRASNTTVRNGIVKLTPNHVSSIHQIPPRRASSLNFPSILGKLQWSHFWPRWIPHASISVNASNRLQRADFSSKSTLLLEIYGVFVNPSFI